ncbi:MAG: hypothetical protein WC069_03680 [Candidatus Shapirobacteria bacterium]
MKKTAQKKKVLAKSNSQWVSVGIVIMILLFCLAAVIKKNRFDEMENRSKSERVINKIEQARDVKNSVKKLIK